MAAMNSSEVTMPRKPPFFAVFGFAFGGASGSADCPFLASEPGHSSPSLSVGAVGRPVKARIDCLLEVAAVLEVHEQIERVSVAVATRG